MTTTTLPAARLTRPRQSPPNRRRSPTPAHAALDPGRARPATRQPIRGKPRNPVNDHEKSPVAIRGIPHPPERGVLGRRPGELVHVGVARLVWAPAGGAQCLGEPLGELADVERELPTFLAR